LEEKLQIQLLQNRNEEAFRKLVADFSTRIYNTCLSIVQQQQDAEDITQEVFTEIFQSITKFKGDSKLSTWIYRITLSKSLEFLRKKNRKKRFGFMQNLFGEDSISPITDIPNFYHPGVQLENKERSKILFAAIDRLPENQKTAFVLHKMEELSYTDIADVLKVSIPSVESLMFRAKQNLRKILDDYYEKNEK
jgi:RNA polymerase sigma-70 factor (ECF subfamily)